jgi:hypothetical protein
MYCPNWVKFGVRSLQSLSSISEFWRKPADVKTRTLLSGANRIKLTHLPQNRYDILKLKNALVTSVYSAQLLHVGNEHYKFILLKFYVVSAVHFGITQQLNQQMHFIS